MKKEYGPAEYTVGVSFIIICAMILAGFVGTLVQWIRWGWDLT